MRTSSSVTLLYTILGRMRPAQCSDGCTGEEEELP